MGLCDGLSHCKLALAFAVMMDLLGGAALLVGVFAPLEIRGRDFGDLLVYTGMTPRSFVPAFQRLMTRRRVRVRGH